MLGKDGLRLYADLLCRTCARCLCLWKDRSIVVIARMKVNHFWLPKKTAAVCGHPCAQVRGLRWPASLVGVSAILPVCCCPTPLPCLHLQEAKQREECEVTKYKIMLRRNQLAYWIRGRSALVSVFVRVCSCKCVCLCVLCAYLLIRCRFR